jgi:hypothetical protein
MTEKEVYNKNFKLFFQYVGNSSNPSKRKAAQCIHCQVTEKPLTFDAKAATKDNFAKHVRCCTNIPLSLAEEKDLFVALNKNALKEATQTSPQPKIEAYCGRKLSESEAANVNKLLLRWFVTSAIPFNAVDNIWAREFFKAINHNYKPVSRRTLSDVLLLQEYNEVSGLIQTKIESSDNISLVVDGWTDLTGKSIYAIVLGFSDGTEQLYKIFDASAESHTGDFLKRKFIVFAREVGLHRIAAIVSDSASNMVKARELFVNSDGCKHILNVRCFMHAFGVTMGSILGHPELKLIATMCQRIVSFVRASHAANAILHEMGKNSVPEITTGLVSSNTTRITSMFLCIESVLINKLILEDLADNGHISKEEVKNIITNGGFWQKLRTLHHLLKPFSDVIMSIQSNDATLSDVTRYWIYLTQSLTAFVSASNFSAEVKAHIQHAFNKRTAEIPPVTSLLALFLDPRYRVAFIPMEEDDLKLLIKESIKIMCNSQFTSDDLKLLVRQIKQYQSWDEPFCYYSYAGSNFDVVRWWKQFGPEMNVLSTLAIKLHQVKPHGAGVERVFSLFDWHQAKRRNRMHMTKVHHSAAVCQFYKNKEKDSKEKGEKRKIIEIDPQLSDFAEVEETGDELAEEALEQLLEEVYEDDKRIPKKRGGGRKRGENTEESSDDYDLKWDKDWLKENSVFFLCFTMVDYGNKVFSSDYDPTVEIKGKERTFAAVPNDITDLDAFVESAYMQL